MELADPLNEGTAAHLVPPADHPSRLDEDLIQCLVDTAPIGLAVIGMDRAYVTANAAYCQFVGYSLRDLVTLETADMLNHEDLPRMWAGAGALLAGECTKFEFEVRLRRSDGGELWVQCTTTLLRGKDGGPRYFLNYVHDIAAKRDAEERLRRTQEQQRLMLDSLNEGVFTLDDDGVIQMMNGSAERILGRTLAEIGGVSILDRHWKTYRPDGSAYELAEHPLTRCLEDGTPMDRVITGVPRPPTGEMRWMEMSVRRSDGTGVVCTINDVTQSLATQAALRASEELFRTTAEALPLALFRTDAEGQHTYVNPRWVAITGRSVEQAPTTRLLDVVHRDDRDRALGAIRQSLQSGHLGARFRMTTHDGSLRWAHLQAVPIRNDGGGVDGFVGCIEDITPLVTAREETDRLAAIIESTSDLIVIFEPGGKVVYTNRAARERLALGADPGAMADLTAGQLFVDDFEGQFRSEILPVLMQGQQWSGDLIAHTRLGHELVLSETLVGELDTDGQLTRVASVGRDITERKRAEAELAHQATHDQLTGLPNRAKLLEHLELAAARSALTGLPLALLFLDLDRFKWVNDRLGHDSGDLLLQEAARRLASVTRDTDIVARLGGDEFVVVCNGVTGEEDAVQVATRVLEALEGEPIRLKDHEVKLSASIGIAVSTGDDHPESLLREADAAMYRAKEQGRSRFELFDDAMRTRTKRRVELSDQLAQGLERGEIVPYFQPTVDLNTGRVAGLEALARWLHPTRGILTPTEFIVIAEETGLVSQLGMSMLTQALAEARRWHDRFGAAAPVVHVNISPRQLSTSSLVQRVADELRKAGVPASGLCLEITENALMDDVNHAVTVLGNLKDIGVQLAVDDFGTGYSSLSYLRRFPVDVLKVDRSFVDGLGPDPEDSAIVAAVVKLAHTLELRAVAEGVETEDQLARLQLLGCDEAQGYLFSPARPADEILSQLEEWVVRPKRDRV